MSLLAVNNVKRSARIASTVLNKSDLPIILLVLQRKLDLAVMVDLYSRKAVGWSMSKKY